MFIIEVALVGISTQDKWLRKFERDRAKLSTFIPDDSSLIKVQLLVLVADYKNVLEEWEYWLGRSNFWCADRPIVEISSSEEGEVVICGWDIAT